MSSSALRCFCSEFLEKVGDLLARFFRIVDRHFGRFVRTLSDLLRSFRRVFSRDVKTMFRTIGAFYDNGFSILADL